MQNRLVYTRLPLLQNRPKREEFRGDGSDFDPLVQEVGDAFYRCAVEINKVIYSRIDARYPSYLRDGDRDIREQHKVKMDEARRTLNEARNDVLRLTLPMFIIRRRKEGEVPSEADIHAHDYIVCNTFDQMVKTHRAWVDQYVPEEEVDALTRTIEKVAAIQRERLAQMLWTYSFGFKTVVLSDKKPE